MSLSNTEYAEIEQANMIIPSGGHLRCPPRLTLAPITVQLSRITGGARTHYPGLSQRGFADSKGLANLRHWSFQPIGSSSDSITSSSSSRSACIQAGLSRLSKTEYWAHAISLADRDDASKAPFASCAHWLRVVGVTLQRRQKLIVSGSRDAFREVGAGGVCSGGGLVGNHPIFRESQLAD